MLLHIACCSPCFDKIKRYLLTFTLIPTTVRCSSIEYIMSVKKQLDTFLLISNEMLNFN